MHFILASHPLDLTASPTSQTGIERQWSFAQKRLWTFLYSRVRRFRIICCCAAAIDRHKQYSTCCTTKCNALFWQEFRG